MTVDVWFDGLVSPSTIAAMPLESVILSKCRSNIFQYFCSYIMLRSGQCSWIRFPLDALKSHCPVPT